LLLNVTDPVSPSFLGGMALPGSPQRFDVAGNYVFVANTDSGLQIVDITTPSEPLIVVSHPTPYNAQDVIVEDTICYLLCAHMLIIIDVSDISNLSELSNLTLGSFWNPTMDKKGYDIYFFADYGEVSFIQAINVADPLNPRVVDNAGVGYCIRDICAAEDILMAVSDCWNSLYTYDISVPDSILGYHYAHFPTPTSVCSGMDYSFIALKQGGISIIDCPGPDTCLEVGFYETEGSSQWVRMVNDYLYLADSSSLQILRFVGAGNCHYIVGDVNSNGEANGLDVTFCVSYFKGGPVPDYSCECTPGNTWYVAGDVNASCTFNGLDVTYFVAFLKGGSALAPCPDCPPGL
jgi:hypothetical protein